MAGIYGMNFEHMPELSWRWAYPSVWLAMFAMVLGMVWFFRRQGWISSNSKLAGELSAVVEAHRQVSTPVRTRSDMVLDHDMPLPEHVVSEAISPREGRRRAG